jgi:S1-C subfamily serine protease
MRLTSVLILIVLLYSKRVNSQIATTDYPSVSSTNCYICRIKKVIVDYDYTRVLLEINSQSKGSPWVSFSSWTALLPYESPAQVTSLRKLDLDIPKPEYADPQYLASWRELAELIKARREEVSQGGSLILGVDNYELETKYNIKSKDSNQKFEFWLQFNKIPIGTEELLIIELTTEGWEFVRIKINNPDTSPKTNWNEISLKIDWEKNGLDPIEGIYENTATDVNSSKYRVALKRNEENYDLIYLAGAGNPIWRVGDIKANIAKTASPNLFKAKWYMGDKRINEDQYASFDKGVMKITGSGGDQLYLKLYPTTSSDFSSGNTTSSSGTGFALSENGYIATNHHVIQGNKIKVRGVKGDFSRTYEAKVVIEDKNNDLAIIKIEDPNFTTLGTLPYKIENSMADVGASVFALGYPLRATMGDEVKLTNGIISSKTGFQGDITAYQISVPVQPGNSGGPLYDSKGNVVGIINAKHALAENASYAIKTSYLLNLIQSMNVKLALPSMNTISNKGLSDQVKFVKEFVYIIETN